MNDSEFQIIKQTINMFDTIDGKHVVYDDCQPEIKYPVSVLLDGKGAETDDPEKAFGGIVEFGPECFVPFWWSQPEIRVFQ